VKKKNMNEKHLHIVALDIPWPANYGGVVDLFYKLKSLQQLGVKIHLHCFTHNRESQDELNKYCVTVNYYRRKDNSGSFSFSLPLIVKSRKNDELIANLNKDNYPVLLEGIHCTYYLHAGALNNRKVMVRLHNVEFEYYKQLAKNESNLFKKLYFIHESRLLYRYEKNIVNKAGFIAVSEQDVMLYRQLFSAKDIYYLPVFIPHTMAVGKEGKGCFCLYHGNLSINENQTAAIWLLQNVFAHLNIPFVIAGKDPSKKLMDMAQQYKQTCIVANPAEKEMQDLIAKAQVHILPSFNRTGIKLKLLNALYNGRHCVVNPAGVEAGLESLCHIATDAASFKKIIEEIYQVPFTEEEKEKRQGLLSTIFDNEKNAGALILNFEF
jgi:glycosyltransferase involved in cell wall biosynthesis